MNSLIAIIAVELERPRELTAQVVKHLDDAYGIDRDAIGPFLRDRLAALGDDEHDLIFSSLFTPKLKDQAIFAEQLGRQSIPRQNWPAIIVELSNRPVTAHLITSDRQTHRIVMREVSIERFVHRLRLEGTVSETTFRWIEQFPAANHPLLKAIARRAVWEDSKREAILQSLLRQSLQSASAESDAVKLLALVEDYQPVDAVELLARIPRWRKMLEAEINAAFDPKPFFSTTVHQLHGGNDQRQRDETRAAAKRSELAFLERLQTLLGSN